MDANLSLSLVIPAFNEADVIAQAIAEAEAALFAHFDQFEILVVDDGSSDDTVAVASAARTRHMRLLRHERNRGYGAALRTGFEAARFNLVAFTDADCQFDLSELITLAKAAEHSPIVVGKRVRRQDPWRRRVLSRGYNLLARNLLGTRVRDVDCALKVFRREVLSQLMPCSRGFFVNTEMLTRARLLGQDVSEVPVTHRARLGGTSKVSLREVPRTLRTMLCFWWQEVLFTSHRPRPVTVLQTRVAVPSATPARVTVPRPSNESGLPAAPRARSRGAA